MKTELTELIADVKAQVLYMQELGVDGLNVELECAPEQLVDGGIDAVAQKFVSDFIAFEPPPKSTSAKPESRLSALPSLTNRNQTKPGGPTFQTPRTSEPVGSIVTLKEEALFDIGPTLPDATETIESIRAEIGECTRCPLYSGRTQVVHSTGNFRADLMFVGEAPGADEDEQGFPFVGRAGQLLTKIIEGIGIKREDVFIGNINRCRPPGNRQPVPIETEACRPFLLREVAVVRPRVIVVLGNTATQNLLGIKTPISKLRGNFQDYFGVKVMPTFHPAYLLRDPHKKREVWEDMKKVRDYLKLGS